MLRIVCYPLASFVTFTIGTSLALFVCLNQRSLKPGYLIGERDVNSAPTPEAPRPTRESREDDEYSVYSRVIDEMFTRDAKVVVISSEMSGMIDGTAFQSGPSLGSCTEAVDDFVANNRSPYRLTNSFHTKTKCLLVTDRQLAPVFRTFDRWWHPFYAKYKGSAGLLNLRRPGFNRARTKAFLYATFTCGGLCGEGYNIILVKRDGAWKIKRSILMVVS